MENIFYQPPKPERKFKIITDAQEINNLKCEYRENCKGKFKIDNREVFICSLTEIPIDGIIKLKIEYIES